MLIKDRGDGRGTGSLPSQTVIMPKSFLGTVYFLRTSGMDTIEQPSSDIDIVHALSVQAGLYIGAVNLVIKHAAELGLEYDWVGKPGSMTFKLISIPLYLREAICNIAPTHADSLLADYGVEDIVAMEIIERIPEWRNDGLILVAEME